MNIFSLFIFSFLIYFFIILFLCYYYFQSFFYSKNKKINIKLKKVGDLN